MVRCGVVRGPVTAQTVWKQLLQWKACMQMYPQIRRDALQRMRICALCGKQPPGRDCFSERGGEIVCRVWGEYQCQCGAEWKSGQAAWLSASDSQVSSMQCDNCGDNVLPQWRPLNAGMSSAPHRAETCGECQRLRRLGHGRGARCDRRTDNFCRGCGETVEWAQRWVLVGMRRVCTWVNDDNSPGNCVVCNS